MSPPVLSFENISFRYRVRPILQDVSAEVHPGEVVGLVGPNGAGKSTLVRIALGLARPSRGAVRLNGRDIRSLSGRERARLAAYVPQSSPPAFPMSVFESVLLGRTPHLGRSVTREDTAMVERLLTRLRLEAFANRNMAELSGGERQRVMLARALAQDTTLLVLDEPTSALDIGNQLFTLRLVRQLAQERKIAIIVAIHDLSLAARFATRLLLLDKGRIRSQGDWRETLTETSIREVYGVSAHIGLQHGEPVFVPY